MSNNKNLYDLLGNDVSDNEEETPIREVVKQQTSTKKSGVPPKADKTKARKNRPHATGNEAGAKLKNDNHAVEGPAITQRKSGKAHAGGDRRSRTGRTDTAKAQKNRLGDEAEAQDEGSEDAAEEAAEEAEEAEDTTVYKSYEDYLKEKAAAASIDSAPKTVAPAENTLADAEVIVKEVEVFAAPTSGKKSNHKVRKEKKLLDIDLFVVEDSSSKPSFRGDKAPRGGRGGRGGARGGRGGPRGGRGGPRGGRRGGDRTERSEHRGDHGDHAEHTGRKGRAPRDAKPVSKLTPENFPSL